MSAEAKPTPMICPACNTHYAEGGAFCSRDGTPLMKDPESGKTDLVGQILADRYRVVRLIGEGGMGQVYEAQHVNINRRFAIKLLRPEIVSNAEAVARFRQEAWSASSIGHDNIIEIEDFATLPSGAVYLAMEFLVGQSLAERMHATPPLTFAQALDVCLQVASGLGAAHEKSIVHRDMKPENIFLAHKHNFTRVKILDFGIAKVSGADGNKSLTRTGTIFGTPHYMSPEQALGKPLDHRADIYSVGVIMYELFTGKVPFEAESFMGILTKHITTAPTPPSQLVPDLAPEIEAVILRAMAKEADDRYQSMAELEAQLVAIAEARAPELLMPRGSQVLAAARRPDSGLLALPGGSPSAALPRATPQSGARPLPEGSGARPLPEGSGARPLPAGARGAALSAPLTATRPQTPSALLAAGDSLASDEAPRKSRGALWLAVGGGILLGATAAVVWSTRTTPKPPVVVGTGTPPASATPTTGTPPATTGTPPATTGTPPATTVTPPPAPALEEVIVDSLPPLAKIYIDGVAVADTPEAIKVEKGKTKAIVLKKDGFVDQRETLDPARSRKVLVRLERVAAKKRVETRPPAKLPTLPPSLTADPQAHGPATHPTTPAHATPTPTPTPPRPVTPPAQQRRKVLDPYERVDEPKKPDVLNPYQ